MAIRKIKVIISSLIQSICTVLTILLFGTSFLTALVVVAPVASLACASILSVVYLTKALRDLIVTQLQRALCKMRATYNKLALETSAFDIFQVLKTKFIVNR
jgi:hypothetical protein